MGDFDSEWDFVRKNLGYPNLLKPKIVNGQKNNVTTAQINMFTKDILISKSFMEELGLPYDLSYIGISAHEANHYVTCPFDLKTKIVLDLEANNISSEHGLSISNYFADVIINLDLINRNINEIVDVYAAIDSEHKVDETIRGLYYLKTGLDFGLRNKNNIDINILNEINSLDYFSLDLNSMKKNIKQFAEAIAPLFETKKEPKLFIDSNLFKEASKQDIDRSLREVADEYNPDEYSDAKKFYGLNNDDSLNRIDYYDALSLKYPLIVKKKEFKSGVISIDYSNSEWQSDDEFSSIDYYKSSGKFFPGLTKKRTRINKEISLPLNDSSSIPDSLIIIDSSASMINPFYERSNAVLASFVIANYYLRRNKKVGVINFSSYSKNKDFTNKKIDIFKSLIEYQNEGTTLDIDIVCKKILGNTLNQSDIYLITDFDISNKDEVIKKLEKNRKTNRINIFVVGGGNNYTNGKLKIYSVNSESDLSNIVIEDLKEYRSLTEAAL